MSTVTFLPGVTPPDQLAQRREAETARREAGKCPDPECRQLKPNHLWACGTRKPPAGGHGDLGGDAA